MGVSFFSQFILIAIQTLNQPCIPGNTNSLWYCLPACEVASVTSDSCDPMDHSLLGSSVLGFSRQEYQSGLLFPSPGDLSYQGIETLSPVSPALAGRFFTTSTTWEAHLVLLVYDSFHTLLNSL